MREIGRIVRLQIQTASLKKGDWDNRYYDPAALLVVPALKLTRQGVIGLVDGRELIDVHHSGHEQSKNRDSNGVSFNFTSQYDRMRAHFGSHLLTGCAGENILVETSETVDLAALSGGLVIETSDGRRGRLTAIEIAAPCLAFSKYALNLEMGAPAEMTKTALQFLDGGTRGFNSTLAGEPLVVRPGDRVMVGD